jgi:tol-pal system protein YbgF
MLWHWQYPKSQFGRRNSYVAVLQPQPDHGLMTRLPLSVLRTSLTAAALWAGVTAGMGQAALGQAPSGQGGSGDSPGFLDGLFGPRGEQPAPDHRDRLAQASAADLSVRIDRLEAQIRQMTGVIEELQYRNQQMAEQLRRMQEDGAAGGQQSSTQPYRPAGPATMSRPPALPPTAAPPPTASSPAALPPGRRGDAFDPNQNPNAPGVPRTLGVMPGGGAAANQALDSVAEPPPIGAPGGRAPGEPLNLSTMSGNGVDPGYAPPVGGMPPPERNSEGRNPAAGSQVATLPPSDSPKDYYDLAYGYILRKDYALAEDGFRTFLRKYPSDRMAPEAQYWLGESLFQRQRYRDAAEAFLNVSTKYESTAKAPDALLRLGQSLAVLGEKEAACASLGEVLRKYPRAALGVKQGVDREQKRVGC